MSESSTNSYPTVYVLVPRGVLLGHLNWSVGALSTWAEHLLTLFIELRTFIYRPTFLGTFGNGAGMLQRRVFCV